MKYLFIGDIHNGYELMKSISIFGVDNDYKMVFVGDYVDSFEIDHFEGVKCIELAHTLSRDGHVFLLGNHDMSYMYPNFHKCAGYDESYSEQIKNKLFQLSGTFSFYVDDILVTHAGLHKNLMPPRMFYENLNNFEKTSYVSKYLNEKCSNLRSHLLKQGMARGGNQAIGGITWCDFYEEFVGLEGIIQVFGHTKTKEIREVHVDPEKLNTKLFDEISEEQGKEGFKLMRASFLRDILYFYKMGGIEFKNDDSGRLTGICIDNLEYGEGELLEYDDGTKQFTIIKKEQYEN